MIFDILTIFPNLFDSPLKEGIIRRARQRQQTTINLINIREFAVDIHQMTDDRPFGGGEGMVMKPEPLAAAVKSCRTEHSKVLLLSPQGKRYTQRTAEKLCQENHLVLVCGRYEGVDERFIEGFIDEEISIGDYILTGGELAALVVVDSVVRLLPGVLGCDDSKDRDTFSRNLLKHPQYTRPRNFEGKDVPKELLSGDHQLIANYRFLQSVKNTLKKRPGLLKREKFSPDEKKLLEQAGLLSDICRISATKEPGC